MAGAWTTLTVLDGSGTSRTMRVWDESGTGAGPFTFAQLASNQTGTGAELALETGNISTIAQAVNGTTIRVVEFVGGAVVSASNSLPVQIISGSGLTAVISGTTFVSGGTLTATLNQTGLALSTTNGLWANVMFNNAIVSASVGLPVNLATYINLTAVVSGTTVISSGALTATLNQTGAALSSTNGIYSNILFNNTLVSASVGLPVNLITYAALTAVVSGTTFISGGTVTAVVSGTAVISSGAVTASINQGGSALSATNGIYSNMLLGNAAISSTNPLMVEGDTASGVADANNPIKIGGLAKTSNPAGVSDGNRVNALFDVVGKQVFVQSIRSLKANLFTSLPGTTSEITLIPAISTCFIDIYGCILANTAAASCTITFKDSTGGNSQIEMVVPAGDTRGFMMPESGAFKQTAQNTTWTVTMGSVVTSIVASVLYVKNITA